VREKERKPESERGRVCEKEREREREMMYRSGDIFKWLGEGSPQASP